MLEALARIFHDCFGLEPGKFDRNIRHGDLKRWDSIGHMAMVAALEKVFAIEFQVDEIMDMQSVEQILEVLERRGVGG